MFYTFSFVLFNCSTFIIHKMALISSTVGPFLRILKLILILFLGCFLLLCYWSFRSCEPHVLQHYCACLYQSNTEINVRIRTCDGKGTWSHPDVALFHFHHSNLPVVIFQTLILLLRQKKPAADHGNKSQKPENANSFIWPWSPDSLVGKLVTLETPSINVSL